MSAIRPGSLPRMSAKESRGLRTQAAWRRTCGPGWRRWADSGCWRTGCCSGAAGPSDCARCGARLARVWAARSGVKHHEGRVMIFDRAWVLAIAWLPLAWMVFEWRHTSRRLALLLKGVSLAAILVALAEPRLNISETKVALAVLVDTSASVTAADLDP